ncbi:hypothetical protein PPYR_01872 [Photinus pyralis]|uniref:Uncharacterized protein n=1 Tax=Photinus pyralis TaxID=7054 RepID=A0A5N4B5M0_PHOPY|nr:hypothetical protein PPYR_01872 [Photinus pyralis]
MEMDSDASFSCTPDEIVNAAGIATSNLLPEKSKDQYLKEYDLFMKWRTEKHVGNFSERVLLCYLEEKSKQWKPPTLWSTYSKLKATLLINNNVDIRKYSSQVGLLIKKLFIINRSVGHKPNKSRTFSRDEMYKFLHNAPDEHISLLTNKIDDLEMYSRRNCLLVHGVRENPQENIIHVVKDVIDTMNIDDWVFDESKESPKPC